jgi:hypothetical protein
LWTSTNPRTGLQTGQIEAREYFGQAAYSFFLIIPLKRWHSFRQAIADSMGILKNRGLLPVTPDEWSGPGGVITRSELFTSPQVGNDFLTIFLETREESLSGNPRHQYRVCVVANGPGITGGTIATGPGLTLRLENLQTFLQHLAEVEKILQDRGLLPASEKAA